MDFTHELCTGSTYPRLVLHGEIDLAVRDELRVTLRRAVGLSDGVTEVDLHGVTFLDCAGIGAFVAANDTARQHGRALIVTHPWGIVRRVLEVTGVLPHLSASPAQTHSRHR
jgi:anti-anti-sigma factor